MTTKVDYNNLVATNFTGIFKPKISSIVATDSTFGYTIGNTVSTTGGYIKITGQYFTSGSQVVIKTINTKTSALVTSVTFVNSTELRVTMPSSTAGTKLLFIVSNDGTTAGTTVTYS